MMSPRTIPPALLCCLALGLAGSVWAGRRDLGQVEDPQPCDADEICSLPGFDGRFPSRMYAGYITVDKSAARRLWYTVVQSEGNVLADPVILWLTGGPGCSSLDAWVYEHGPFNLAEVDAGAGSSRINLTVNPHSWSKAATMIYVDSPAGTGLSYSETPSDYHTNDSRTVDDLVIFLLRLRDKYTFLDDQDIYLAGESYAGVYVPKLAQQILNTSAYKYVNLKGYILGNPVTDDRIDVNSQIAFSRGVGLIDTPTYYRLDDACDGEFWNATAGSKCYKQLEQYKDAVYSVNPYNILEPCHFQQDASPDVHDTWHSKAAHIIRALWLPGTGATRSPHSTRSSTHASAARQMLQHPQLQHVVACGDRRLAIKYMNRDDVRSALHAQPVSEIGKWTPCSDVLTYDGGVVALVDMHEELQDQGMRVLVYSGDHDLIIPSLGTQRWIYGMDLPISSPYSAWLIDRQAAGFMVKFKPDFTYATVMGAGHMVPSSKPREALELVRRFLQAKG